MIPGRPTAVEVKRREQIRDLAERIFVRNATRSTSILVVPKVTQEAKQAIAKAAVFAREWAEWYEACYAEQSEREPMYEVTVGNVGTVMVGTDNIRAHAEYNAYVKLSRDGVGRMAGEPVVLFRDGVALANWKGGSNAES
jgi:hypothetical protein